MPKRQKANAETEILSDVATKKIDFKASPPSKNISDVKESNKRKISTEGMPSINGKQKISGEHNRDENSTSNIQFSTGQKRTKIEKGTKENARNSINRNVKLAAAESNGHKKMNSNNGLPIIKSIIPNAYPLELQIQVSNLPMHFKQIEIIETFNSYGSIAYIQNLSKNNAIVAFIKEEEAQDAILGSNKLSIRGRILKIKKRVKKNNLKHQKIDPELFERTVFVFRVNPSATEEDVKQHFNKCGKVESVKHVKRAQNHYFIVVFVKKEFCQAASKLHNSILLERNINVRLKVNKPIPWDMKRSITVLNPQGLIKLDYSQLTKVFAPCGEIEACDVICSKQKLAIITFKTEESAQKALQLNGTTQEGLDIQVELYSNEIKQNSIPAKVNPYVERFKLLKETKRKIIIKKLPIDTTIEEISTFFKACGTVKIDAILKYNTVVEFDSVEGYCKAFRYNESKLKGQILYILPYSEVKPPTFVKDQAENGQKRAKSFKNSPPTKKVKRN